MKRLGFMLCVALVVIVAAAGVGAQPPQKVRPPEDKGGHVADEVLVAFRDRDQAPAVARAVGARVGRVLGGLGVYVLKVPAGSVEGTVRALTHNPMVEYAEPNGYLHTFVTPDDPYLSACYTPSHDACVTQWSWVPPRHTRRWSGPSTMPGTKERSWPARLETMARPRGPTRQRTRTVLPSPRLTPPIPRRRSPATGWTGSTWPRPAWPFSPPFKTTLTGASCATGTATTRGMMLCPGLRWRRRTWPVWRLWSGPPESALRTAACEARLRAPPIRSPAPAVTGGGDASTTITR